jgi:mannose-6-phosphate isomerase-like protein (cupin superfamily)
MRVEHSDPSADKGWYMGPWDCNLTIAVGYANRGVDEPHEHSRLTEIYLVAQGTAEMRIERETVQLEAGDMIAVEPGEAHTFLSSSPDYLHFVVHAPTWPGEAAHPDKIAVPRTRLGL